MIQFYLLSVLFLCLSAGLLLVDKYGTTLLFLINFKNFYRTKKAFRIVFLSGGFVSALGLVFFPVSPGPMVLGDLLPAVNIIFLLIYLLKRLRKTEDVVDYNNGKRNALGFVTLGVAFIHFLFPGIVII
ncbi:MAG: hypothetical protein J5775_06280 [Spirochaetales bacterium]|nr:hypothetical protein [Spirochaetales bacterium]